MLFYVQNGWREEASEPEPEPEPPLPIGPDDSDEQGSSGQRYQQEASRNRRKMARSKILLAPVRWSSLRPVPGRRSRRLAGDEQQSQRLIVLEPVDRLQ
jgi:hypothetical protein